jgi:phosphoribulokinase
MSKRHPVVSVTGSSGAGTSTVKRAFEYIFRREGIIPAVVEGDSYHRYERAAMKEAMAAAVANGENFSHFGPAANRFDKLEELFSARCIAAQPVRTAAARTKGRSVFIPFNLAALLCGASANRQNFWFL